HVIFFSRLGDSVNLWQVAITPKTWQIQGPAQRLTTGADWELDPSLAADGRLVFATADEHQDLWTLPIDADRSKVTGKTQQLTLTGGNCARPSLSSDGRRLVFLSDSSGNGAVWT